MKLFKGLLLGSVAGIAAVAGANAADLPNKKGTVEYVRVCSEYGKGFFYIPGSDACIQIGGRVRADTEYRQVNYRGADAVGFGANARINLDVRQNTPYGTVRAYLRYSLAHSASDYQTAGKYTTNTGLGGNSNTAGQSGLDLAYIQFAGLTAGRVQSFFDYYADNYNFAAIRSSDVKTQALAYTFNFGNGWSATAALEDGNERRMYGVYNNAPFSTPTTLVTPAGAYINNFRSPAVIWNSYDNGAVYWNNGNGYTPAGQTAPDVVGQVMVNQSWGTAQMSAALHQVRPVYTNGNADANGLYSRNGTTNWANKDTSYGWAVKGAVKLNLPMIAPGDELWVEAAYSQGALSYIGANNYGFMPNLNIPIADAFVGANGNVKLASGWSVMADFLHYWTPSLRSNLFASYMKIDSGNNAYGQCGVGIGGVGTGCLSGVTGTALTYNYGFVPVSEFRVGTNLIWSPVKNFDIGVEVLYTKVDPKGRVLDYNNGNAGAYARTISSEDNWQGRLRIQRDF